MAMSQARISVIFFSCALWGRFQYVFWLNRRMYQQKFKNNTIFFVICQKVPTFVHTMNRIFTLKPFFYSVAAVVSWGRESILSTPKSNPNLLRKSSRKELLRVLRWRIHRNPPFFIFLLNTYLAEQVMFISYWSHIQFYYISNSSPIQFQFNSNSTPIQL